LRSTKRDLRTQEGRNRGKRIHRVAVIISREAKKEGGGEPKRKTNFLGRRRSENIRERKERVQPTALPGRA